MGGAVKLNKSGLVMAVGVVAKDATMRTTQSGKEYCSFSVRTEKKEDGTWTYVNCKAWRKAADYCSALCKGDPVLVVGTLNTYEYNDKTYTDLVVDWANSTELGGVEQTGADQLSGGGNAGAAFEETDEDEGSLPF